MNDDEVLLSYVRAIAATTKKHCAIYYDPKAGKVFSVGLEGTLAFETAAINAIMPNREEDTDKKRRFRVYASYQPTNADIGLAWRADVGLIIYVDDATDKVFTLTTVNPTNAGYKTKPGLPDVGGSVAIEGLPKVIDEKGLLFTKPYNDAGFLAEVKKLAAKSKFLKDLLAEGAKPTSTRVSYPSVRALIRNTTDKKTIVSTRKKTPSDTNQDVVDAYYARLVYALVNRAWLEKPDKMAFGSRKYGNNIGCLLTNSANEIIAWGLNYKSLNPNFHAETLMIQEYLYLNNTSVLPAGCTLYTSLESCYMCAGFFCDAAKQGGRCVFLHEDPQVPGNAFQRKVNGCAQLDADKLKIPADLAKDSLGTLTALQKDAKTDTITFLFSATAREKYKLEADAAHELYLDALFKLGDDAPSWVSANCMLFLLKLRLLAKADPLLKQIAEYVV